MLDPILYDLFDPSIQYSPSTTELKGKQLQGFIYDRAFDQHYVNYLLETLLSVVKFGGQGFSKIARSTPVARSLYGGLLQRLRHGKLCPPKDVMSHFLINSSHYRVPRHVIFGHHCLAAVDEVRIYSSVQK